jgi:hypothetical protein
VAHIRAATLSAVVALCALLTGAVVGLSPAFAHHGWTWAEGDNSELSGTVVAAKLGNPHGELTLDVQGQHWTVEVGQPWRNQQAGLSDQMLAKGARLTVSGHKSANPKQRVFKAERVFIDGKKYDLYPDRN